MSEGSSLFFQSVRLASRDWLHEFGLSFCAVLALASILAPLLILHGVHNGVVERLREKLMQDPAVLVIVPQGTNIAGYDDAFLEKIRSVQGVRYAIGRSRDVAAEIEAVSPKGRRATLYLDATSPGDPLLESYSSIVPHSSGQRLEIALSASAARKLEVQTGDVISTSLVRRQKNGRLERLPIQLYVASVLPPAAQGSDMGLVDMQTLFAIQDYRDGFSSSLLKSDGEENPAKERKYAAFRVYAVGLDDVENIEKWFIEQDIQVNTRGRDIANIRKIDSTLGAVITLIAVAGITGFFAFMASSSEASVRRKWKQIGMLRLTGFSRGAILAFPLSQAILTGVFGCLLAYLVYGIVAWSIDIMFAQETGGETICSLSPMFLVITFVGIQIMAIMASGWAGIKASKITPAVALREN